MTKKYRQLSQEQRYQMESLLKASTCQSRIAEILQVDRSTISRELKRNGTIGNRYDAKTAALQTALRHRQKAKHIRFSEEMKGYIRSSLKEERYSPELIHVQGKKRFGDFVSLERIYQWIWHCKKSQSQQDQPDRYLFHYLRHGKRRQKRSKQKGSPGIIKNRTFISERPAIINHRKRIGDKEADLIMGRNYSAGVLILTDRKARMSWLEKIYNKEASHIQKAIEKIIRRCEHKVKSITFDNDKSFANHYLVAEKYKIKTFFTHPYSSQEKGTVENRIGVIRRFFDKQTDFSCVTAAQINKVEQLINDRPLRMFNYKSSKQVYQLLL